MRVALCYSGDVRTFSDTIENHLEAFAVNDNIHIDFFGHFWDGLDSHLSSRFKKIIINPKQEKYFWKLARHTGFMPTYEHRSFVFFSGQGNGANSLSMFYGIEISINLALSAENDEGFKYDFIFRMRPDLLFSDGSAGSFALAARNKNPLAEGIFGIKKLNSYDGSKLNVTRPLHLLGRSDGERGALNDWFAFGNGLVMGKYCRVYSNIKDLIETRPYSPEEMLYTHVKKMGLKTCINNWGLLLCK